MCSGFITLLHIMCPAWNFFHRERETVTTLATVRAFKFWSSVQVLEIPNKMMKGAAIQYRHDKQDTCGSISESFMVEMRKQTKNNLALTYNSRRCNKANLYLLFSRGEWYFCLIPPFPTRPRNLSWSLLYGLSFLLLMRLGPDWRASGSVAWLSACICVHGSGLALHCKPWEPWVGGNTSHRVAVEFLLHMEIPESICLPLLL